METTKSAVIWFEIPVTDLERATGFYEAVLDTKLKTDSFQGTKMAFFPCAPGLVGGALITVPERSANESGTLVYLDCGDDLLAAIERTKGAGGKSVGEVIVLPENMGSYIHIEDTEGNRVGLHATN